MHVSEAQRLTVHGEPDTRKQVSSTKRTCDEQTANSGQIDEYRHPRSGLPVSSATSPLQSLWLFEASSHFTNT